MNGVELIAAERTRQITKEGWTPGHDEQHANEELAKAAVAYAMPNDGAGNVKLAWWPWERIWWKPSRNRVLDLVKAGALIAAEIDRLQRLAASGSLSGKQR